MSFTESQKIIIESFGLGQAVIAGAGCGKTTTLVAKCIELVKHKQDARFCAVSFTEKSVNDLKQSLQVKFKESNVPYDFHHHTIKTIHGLCASILQEFPLEAGLQGGETIILEDESISIWNQSLKPLWALHDQELINEAVARLLADYSKAELESLLIKLRTLISFGVEKFKDRIPDLWLVFQSVYLRYEHAKARRGVLDFNDLELKAFKALEAESVRSYYHRRFDLVLVDEFQDTNPLQGQILERFVKKDLSNLCVVGDPKQSIYRFRDADVSVFQELSARTPLKHLLDVNYRSVPPIIDFVNEVCAPVFQASKLNYEPLVAGKQTELESAAVFKLILENENTLADFLKSEVQKGADLSDYVLLVRFIKKDKMQKIFETFEKKGVPYILGSGGQFYLDPRVIELISFLKGFISSGNTLSQVAALRSPWIGITDETLFQWQQSEKNSYYKHFFKTTHPIAVALKEYYENPFKVRPGQILERLYEIVDPELYMPLLSLWHKSENLSKLGSRFDQIIKFFTDAVTSKKVEKEIPPPTEKGVLRILTVHGSKGLQFKKVILIDFDGQNSSRGNSTKIIWDRNLGIHLKLSLKNINPDEKDTLKAIDQRWTELEASAALAESKRLFYVAITRAEDELILAYKKEVKESAASKKPDFNPYMTDNWRLWIDHSMGEKIAFKESVKILELPFELSALKPQAKLEEPFVQPPLLKATYFNETYRPRHSVSVWIILSECEYRYRAKLDLVLEQTQSTSGAEKGTRIHDLIEKENWEKLAQEFVSEAIGESIVALLKQQETNENQVFRELGFEVPFYEFGAKHPEALVGVMDRLEINEKLGLIKVIDYKFTLNEKTDTQILEKYLLQIQIYAWAATRLVDFKINQIEASFFHFTNSSLKIITVDPINLQLDILNKTVKNLFIKSISNNEPTPIKGDYCRHCEVKAICPIMKELTNT